MKMLLKLCFLLLLFVTVFSGCNCQENATEPISSNEVVRECGKVHQIDNIGNISSLITGSFSNQNCSLSCVIANITLPTDLIHEGQPCPGNTTGICRAGQCVDSPTDALIECGLKHSLNFQTIENHEGTALIHDQCMLNCAINGAQLSENYKHEGLPCPTNPNGVCRGGVCVYDTKPVLQNRTTESSSEQSSTAATIEPSSNVTKLAIDLFSPLKIKFLNITLKSTTPPLGENHFMHLYFYKEYSMNPIDSRQEICTFYPARLTNYENATLEEIPQQLNQTSRMSIDLWEIGMSNNQKFEVPLTRQYVDLYALFEGFYQNHKKTFGEEEKFVANFPIFSMGKSDVKVMDVVLRFVIVFSKDI